MRGLYTKPASTNVKTPYTSPPERDGNILHSPAPKINKKEEHKKMDNTLRIQVSDTADELKNATSLANALFVSLAEGGVAGEEFAGAAYILLSQLNDIANKLKTLAKKGDADAKKETGS